MCRFIKLNNWQVEFYEWVYYLQKVQADRGNLSRHAVQGDRQYRADQPIPEDLKDQAGPERRKVAERWLYRFLLLLLFRVGMD